MPKKLYTIPELLNKLRMTQTKFAEENDYTFQSVNKWCLGKMTPSVNTIRALEKKYGVELNYRRNK